MPGMRTTVTLDPDTRRLVERRMAERGISFKQALNEAIRQGLEADEPAAAVTRPKRLGTPRVDLTKALALAADLEDAAIAQRLADGR